MDNGQTSLSQDYYDTVMTCGIGKEKDATLCCLFLYLAFRKTLLIMPGIRGGVKIFFTTFAALVTKLSKKEKGNIIKFREETRCLMSQTTHYPSVSGPVPTPSNMLQLGQGQGGCENGFPITRNILRQGDKQCINLWSNIAGMIFKKSDLAPDAFGI